MIARKGILATTISDIASEAGRSAASFYNYYALEGSHGSPNGALRFRNEGPRTNTTGDREPNPTN